MLTSQWNADDSVVWALGCRQMTRLSLTPFPILYASLPLSLMLHRQWRHLALLIRRLSDLPWRLPAPSAGSSAHLVTTRHFCTVWFLLVRIIKQW